MHLHRRLLAFLVVPALLPAAASAVDQVVRLVPLTTVPIIAAEAPAISFAIPKYTLAENERAIVAACLVLEAANQGEFGMRSVMAVIRNRAGGRPELFASTVMREKQFSALNRLTAGREPVARTLARARADRMWDTALAMVDHAAGEDWQDPTGGATHYTRAGERTPWTRYLARTVTIGNHSFYR